MSKYSYAATYYDPLATKHITVECPEDGWTCRMHLGVTVPAYWVRCPRCHQPCREVPAAAGGHVGQATEKQAGE